ncbi:hypothetical protein THRCLA_08960 [Thraustotheca clavata]|uniref:Myb-like DNA-binding protein n=1 Tax=Thraustotheca clavata TaxID=74557 RepID=A0A1V9Z0I6_9STRA|nr:hypothetical protein THRCLA_08960 [Thraustotheca clavata]
MKSYCSGRWTREEDERLCQVIQRFEGVRVSWMDVAQVMRTRSRQQCQQRWARTLSLGRPLGHWKRVEDDMLYLIMWPSTTCEDWDDVARWMEYYLPTCRRSCSAKACRDRWTNYLSPEIIRTPFTEEEIDIIAKHLPESTSWANLAKHLPGRPPRLIKMVCRKLQWNRMMSPGKHQLNVP